MLTVATAHYLTTLADTKKGSLTNRNQAAKEHFKNDLKFGYTLAIPATAAAIAVASGKTAAISTKTGSFIAKSSSYLSKLFTKLGANNFANGAKKVATEISKNPKKYGLIGLAAAGGLFLAKVTAKYCNTQGRIDQKYEDAAKIESQTKNVVLEEKESNVHDKTIFLK